MLIVCQNIIKMDVVLWQDEKMVMAPKHFAEKMYRTHRTACKDYVVCQFQNDVHECSSMFLVVQKLEKLWSYNWNSKLRF